MPGLGTCHNLELSHGNRERQRISHRRRPVWLISVFQEPVATFLPAAPLILLPATRPAITKKFNYGVTDLPAVALVPGYYPGTATRRVTAAEMIAAVLANRLLSSVTAHPPAATLSQRPGNLAGDFSPASLPAAHVTLHPSNDCSLNMCYVFQPAKVYRLWHQLCSGAKTEKKND